MKFKIMSVLLSFTALVHSETINQKEMSRKRISSKPHKECSSVIFDTDLDSDVDDIGALAVLHALANKGEAKILGVIVTSDDMHSPLCADAINTYFQRPDIPIGVNKKAKLRSFSRYTKGIAEEYHHDLQSYVDAEDATSLYRKILASQPDNSVVIVTVGHLTNLKNLLLSEADTHSPLGGITLVKKKVKLWSCMGGKYPKGKEPNFYRPDPGSTSVCVNRWPKQIVFSGAEIGNPIKTGGETFKNRASSSSPVRRAYELYNHFRGRSSWDQTAVLYAIRGNSDWWSVHRQGYNHTFSDGSNEWRPSPDKDHGYLVEKTAPGELAKIIDELMIQEPSMHSGSILSKILRVLFDEEKHNISVLTNHLTGTNWLSAPSSVYEVESEEKINSKLRVMPLANGQLKMELTLVNTGDKAITVKPNFPLLKGLSPGGDPRKLGYCFPQRNAVIDTKPTKLRQPYSSHFPLQFMSVFHPQSGSITLMTQDLTNSRKTFWLEKTKNGKVDFGVEHYPRLLEPGQTWHLPPAILDAHEGDWHDALKIYRQWIKTWYEPIVSRKQWFMEVFNFRQHFLHKNLGDEAWNPQTKQYRLYELVQDDIKTFGGVDFVHIYDWSTDPQHGRVGQYDPWDYLGGEEELRNEMQKLQKDDIHVGLYLEGYLLDKRSDIAKSYGQKWTVFTEEGVPCTRMGANYWYPCPDMKRWQEYLTNACLSACKKVNPDGIYIDQYGYGTQLICHNTEHSHPIPSNQQKCENQMMSKLRQTLPSTSVLYTEYVPTDVSTQYQDGSFTYANGPINLTRFALPDFKLFVILRCDVPMGNDFDGVKRVFFNGEGLWLEGSLSDKKWFPPEIRKLIAKTYGILHANRDSFTCMSPIPLVPTEDSRILANQFSGKDKIVWTVYNPHDEPVEGEILRVKHIPGATYMDVWNDMRISPRIQGDTAFLPFGIGSQDVSCIIQYRKPFLEK